MGVFNFVASRGSSPPMEAGDGDSASISRRCRGSSPPVDAGASDPALTSRRADHLFFLDLGANVSKTRCHGGEPGSNEVEMTRRGSGSGMVIPVGGDRGEIGLKAFWFVHCHGARNEGRELG